jgi:heme oxygenase
MKKEKQNDESLGFFMDDFLGDSTVNSEAPFYHKKAEGWFWYEELKKELEKKDTKNEADFCQNKIP